MSPFPARTARIDDETAAKICRLDVHGLSQRVIARQAGVNPRTVARVLERVKAATAAAKPLEQELAAAIATYHELQRVAWAGIDTAMERTGKPPALLLAEVRLCQQRIDQLLGLEPIRPEVIEIRQYQSVVLEALAHETPEARSRLAARFREIAGDA